MTLIGQRATLASLAVLGIAGALIYYTSRDLALPDQALDAAPAGTRALLRMDVPAVRRSIFYQELVVEAGRDSAHRALVERCGFDPLDQLEELILFVAGDSAELERTGLVARGPFEHERVAECLRQAATETDTTMERTEIEGLPAVKIGRGEAVMAFVGRRGLAWGQVETVTSVIKAVRNEGGRASSDELLNRLYTTIGRDREIVIVTHIPDPWIPALRQLAQSRGEDVARMAEPFLATRAIGLGARVSVGLAVGALFNMRDSEAAEVLTRSLREELDMLMNQPIISMSPIGPALRRVNVNQVGTDVNIAFDLQQERVENLFSLAERFGGAASGGAPGPMHGPGGMFVPPSGATPAPAPADDPAASEAAPAPSEPAPTEGAPAAP
ncbi:MAG: hypothetical protein H6726_25830 [Sandaracinaceae bacterium]|nr:hypothetical protein [Myxococcales bacterium]MCB9661094.1 hypothetical protein [Sandaracinaceae bacterium]